MTIPSLQNFLAQRADSRLFLPGQGRSAANFLACVTDQYFLSRFVEAGFFCLEKVTMAGVGSYGRQELSLKSDIDVLILTDDLSEEKCQELASKVFHPLWDAGLDIGHGVRSIQGCLELARKDFKVLASLLDARFICGDESFFVRFHECSQALLKEMSLELIRFLTDSVLKRTKEKSAQNFIEPDIKNDPGGFRDYNLIIWLEKLALLSGSVKESLLDYNQKKILINTMDFFFDLRNAVHSLTKRKNDRLYMDLQPQASAIMGYHDSETSSGVEIFLGDLFEKQNRISAIAQELSEKKALCMKPLGLINARNGKDLPPDIFEHGDRLFFSHQGDTGKDPELALNMFRLMAESGNPVSWQAMRQIRNSLTDADYSNHMETQLINIFTRILISPFPDQCLRSMRQAGLLQLVLPELEKIWFFVQFDGVHTYPLGEHSLHCLNMVAVLDESHGFLAEYLGPYKNSLVLRLAALLHDMGKGQTDHSNAGAMLAQTVLHRLNIDQKVKDQVIFLVRNHLLMVDTVLKRDIDEEQVVAEFAARVGGIDGLNLLTFLSYADSMATGTRVWSPWQENLIRKLYFKARHLMQHTILAGHHALHRMATVRDRVRAHELYNESWEGFIRAMPSRYLLKTHVADIIKHIRLVQNFESKKKPVSKGRQFTEFILLTEQSMENKGQFWDLTLVTRDQPGLMAAVAATLTMNQIEIYSARLFTWENGLVVDRFKVSPPLDPLCTSRTWTEVRKDLMSLMTGERDVLQFCNALKKAPVTGSKLRISVDNQSSDFYTIIEIDSPSHPCLTWQICLSLTQLNLDISYSLISTHADQALHVFYIRNNNGQKLAGSHEDLINNINRAVKTVV